MYECITLPIFRDINYSCTGNYSPSVSTQAKDICNFLPRWVPMPKLSILWFCSFKLRIVSSLMSLEATIVICANHGTWYLQQNHHLLNYHNISKSTHRKLYLQIKWPKLKNEFVIKLILIQLNIQHCFNHIKFKVSFWTPMDMQINTPQGYLALTQHELMRTKC